MMNARVFIWGLFMCMSLFPSYAEELYVVEDADTLQDRITIETQLRGRGEYRNGYETLRANSARAAWIVAERARLSLGYERKRFSMKFSAQHTGVWGDESLKNNSNNGHLNVNEAWVRMDIWQGLYAKVGRQEIVYDDERLFGNEDWEMGGLSHDALRLGYTFGRHKVEGILSYSQKEARTIGGTYYKGEVPYKNLQALWYHYDFETLPLELSAIGINQGIEISKGTASKTGFMQTLGVWGKYLYKDYYAKADFYYQLGHDENRASVSAFLLGARIGREENNWGAEFVLDYASGSDGKDVKKNKTFNQLYGSTHDFFGSMDYFTSSNMIVSGVLDIGVNGYYLPPVENLKVNAAYHIFTTGSKFKRLHRFLGQELDLSANYKLMDDVTLSAGYSVMFPTSVMVFHKGGSNKSWQDWGWLSLNVSPSFVTTTFKKVVKK